jgi:hypothetical protein
VDNTYSVDALNSDYELYKDKNGDLTLRAHVEDGTDGGVVLSGFTYIDVANISDDGKVTWKNDSLRKEHQDNFIPAMNSILFMHDLNAGRPRPKDFIYFDGETGEIFIATANGIISYKYTATEAKEAFDSVYAYPNPVKQDYQGLIAIKGLVRDCDVKITDVSGRLIYSTKALGGQAIWDGKNFEGSRAQTGVYVVYITNPDGSKTETTKIFFVN